MLYHHTSAKKTVCQIVTCCFLSIVQLLKYTEFGESEENAGKQESWKSLWLFGGCIDEIRYRKVEIVAFKSFAEIPA